MAQKSGQRVLIVGVKILAKEWDNMSQADKEQIAKELGGRPPKPKKPAVQ